MHDFVFWQHARDEVLSHVGVFAAKCDGDWCHFANFLEECMRIGGKLEICRES